MKIITLLFLLTLFQNSNVFSQSSQYVTIVRLGNGSAFIEFEKVSEQPNIFGGKSASDQGKYWIGPQTNISLQNALKKAISWSKLNAQHQKEFEKEITRFRVTRKETYEFYKRYISEFSDEARLIFQGHSDGSFKLMLEITESAVNITITTEEGINKLIKMLQGKSVNSEIDGIFN